MSKSTFAEGQRVYSEDGYAYVYVAPAGSRHVVRALLDEGTEHEDVGDEQIVERVFAEPPVQERHAEVARLDALIAERETKLSHLDAQAREMRRTLDRNPSIAALVDMLAGKPVFFVTDYGTLIETTKDRKYSECVVTFEQRCDGPHFWIKTKESGHYGSSDHGRVYQTREQAIERVRQVIAEGIKDGERWGLSKAVAAAKGAGLDVPPGAEEKLRALLVAEADKEVADHEARLAAAKAKRAKIADTEAQS